MAIICESTDEGNEVITLPNSVQEAVNNVKVNGKLNANQGKDVANILVEYDIAFTDVPGRTNVIEHKINLNSDKPVNTRQYPSPYAVQRKIDGVDRTLELNTIIPPNSKPLIAVKEKDGSECVCLDTVKIIM